MEQLPEKWLLNIDGDVHIDTGNVVIGTSGKGIDFSAASDLAGMTSELLDDYEEGTYSVTITGDTLLEVATLSNNYGVYTKIGRMVTVNINVSVTNKNSLSGAIQISSAFYCWRYFIRHKFRS